MRYTLQHRINELKTQLAVETAKNTALRAELLLHKEALDWIEQNWSACAFIVEGEFVNLRDDIRSRKFATLRGNQSEKGKDSTTQFNP